MKLNNRFIFGILSLLLAAVIAFVALPTIARQTNGKEEIVRITQPVLKGEQISSENAEVVEVGGYNLPSNIAHQLSDVNGLYATADLAVGDYILTNKISSVPVSSDVALNSIPSGKVAISLTVKTLASGLSDKLQPGDIIRIYHFLDTAAEVPELRFVKVLSVTDSDGINVDNAKEPTEDEEKQQSATITVLASPEQAKIITGLENDGVAHVALISRNNDKLADGMEITLLLSKSTWLKIGAPYRFYFQKGTRPTVGNDYLDAALLTNSFLGYEAISEPGEHPNPSSES